MKQYFLTLLILLILIGIVNAECILNDVGCSGDYTVIGNVTSCCSCVGQPYSMYTNEIQCIPQWGSVGWAGNVWAPKVESTERISNTSFDPIEYVTNKIDEFKIKLQEMNANEDQYRPEEYAREKLQHKIQLKTDEAYAYVLALILLIFELVKIVFWLIIMRLFIFIILELIPSAFFRFRDNVATFIIQRRK